MAPEHPFPGLPYEAISAIAKPKTSPTTPQTVLAPPSPIPCPKKFIVADYDGSETWFGAYEPAMEWFMTSHLASRVYLLCNGAKTLLAGLPPHVKPFKPSLPIPFTPLWDEMILCYDRENKLIGSCRLLGKDTGGLGWRFVPNPVSLQCKGHKPGVKLHSTYSLCIPAWAKPLITKWVLFD